MIAGLSFDAVGTFLHFPEPVAVTYARHARAHGLPDDVDAIDRRLRAAFREAPTMAPPADADAEAFARDWWLAIVARALDAPARDARLQRCFDDLFAWYASPAAWRMNPGFGELLARLKRRGLRLVVVSNYDARLHGLLSSLGLADAFDAVVLPHDAGVQKPRPGIFLRAAARLNLPPSAMLHVGDDEREDVEGARSAGMHAMRWSYPLDEAAARRAGEQLLERLSDGPGREGAS